MQGLIDDVGQYRNTGVGIIKGKKVIHMAPSAERVNGLMFDLFDWLACSDEHPLILSSIFHYEFGGAMTALPSNTAVICISVKVFPSIANEP
jgi:Fic family protein